VQMLAARWSNGTDGRSSIHRERHILSDTGRPATKPLTLRNLDVIHFLLGRPADRFPKHSLSASSLWPPESRSSLSLRFLRLCRPHLQHDLNKKFRLSHTSRSMHSANYNAALLTIYSRGACTQLLDRWRLSVPRVPKIASLFKKVVHCSHDGTSAPTSIRRVASAVMRRGEAPHNSSTT